MEEKAKIALVVLSIILVGFFLRCYDLNGEALWTDEMVTLIHLRQEGTGSLVDSVVYYELMPPGYFLFMDIWRDVFGESEFSLRMVSVLFDVLSILLIYLIGAKLFGRKVGLLSAILLATSMLQIVYAQEARPYAMFGALVLLSTYLFLLLIDPEKAKWRKLLFFGYILVNTIAIYVNYMAVFVWGIHLLGFYFFYPERKRILWMQMAAGVAVGVLFISGIRILYSQFLLRNEVLQQSLVLRGVPELFGRMGVFFYLLPILFVVGAIFLMILFRERLREVSIKRWKSLILILLGIYIMVNLIFWETLMRSFALVRHTFFLVLFFYVLISWCLLSKELGKWGKTVISLVLVLNLVLTGIYYQETTKAPWDEAAEFIFENSEGEAMVLFDRPGANVELLRYYYHGEFREMNLTWGDNTHLEKMSEEEMVLRLEKEEEFWLVSSRNIKTGDYFKDLLMEHYKLEKFQKYKELEIYKFKGMK
jgi:4-amino-4-deoxy-L-arabinose transferase-like glycosyltransferase